MFLGTGLAGWDARWCLDYFLAHEPTWCRVRHGLGGGGRGEGTRTGKARRLNP